MDGGDRAPGRRVRRFVRLSRPIGDDRGRWLRRRPRDRRCALKPTRRQFIATGAATSAGAMLSTSLSRSEAIGQPKPSRIADSTRAWLVRHGLDPDEVSFYLVIAWGEPFDIVRLTARQLARVPRADRPMVTIAEDGRDCLAYLPVAMPS